jgi:carbon storage regulator
MLVLGRKPGESVVMSNDIEVRVIEIRGGRVKLGFKAPPYVTIWRSELQRDEEQVLLAMEEAACS